jgi:hypothetical protein
VNRLFHAVLLTVFIFVSGGISGQSASIFDELAYSSRSEGKVQIIQDDAIKILVEKHQLAKSKSQGITGYRIRIFSNSGTTAKAGYNKAMAQFAYSYGNIPIYDKFVYPNYKIYVGDFRTESEALKFRKRIENKFAGAFIVQSTINYPKLDMNE